MRSEATNVNALLLLLVALLLVGRSSVRSSWLAQRGGIISFALLFASLLVGSSWVVYHSLPNGAPFGVFEVYLVPAQLTVSQPFTCFFACSLVFTLHCNLLGAARSQHQPVEPRKNDRLHFNPPRDPRGSRARPDASVRFHLEEILQRDSFSLSPPPASGRQAVEPDSHHRLHQQPPR